MGFHVIDTFSSDREVVAFLSVNEFFKLTSLNDILLPEKLGNLNRSSLEMSYSKQDRVLDVVRKNIVSLFNDTIYVINNILLLFRKSLVTCYTYKSYTP